MAKFVYLLVCLAVLVPTAFTLKCYICSSDKPSGCLKSTRPDSIMCNSLPVAPGHKNVCVYKHTVYQDHSEFINATCEAIGLNGDLRTLATCVRMPGGPVIKECRMCETDYCNSAPGFSTKYLSLLYLPIFYFVIKLIAN